MTEALVTDEMSIGDYVLTGGELPALVVIDAMVRLVPGVVGDAESVAEDSFVRGVLDYPHYTRPAVFRGPGGAGRAVVGATTARLRTVARSGERLRRTLERRPDLLADAVAATGGTSERLLDELRTELKESGDEGD